MNHSSDVLLRLAELFTTTSDLLRELAASNKPSVTTVTVPNVMSGPEKPDRLTVRDAAEFLSVSRRTLEKWRNTQREGSPPYVKLCGRIYYSRAKLEAWLNRQKVTP